MTSLSARLIRARQQTEAAEAAVAAEETIASATPAQEPAPAEPQPAEPVPASPAPKKSDSDGEAKANAERKANRQSERMAEIAEQVNAELLSELGPKLYETEIPEEEVADAVRQALQKVLQAESSPLSTKDQAKISSDISNDILGHGPLEPLLRDPEVSEIMVNGPFEVYVERAGKLRLSEVTFRDEKHLRRTIDKIVARVGRRVDESSPLVDARLLDGSRVNAVIPPIALDGSLLTIRKFSTDPLTDEDLIRFGTITPKIRDFLRACILGRRNIIISGGTGSGKTTTLNVLSSFIPSDERVVTVEDAAELQLKQDHVLRLESRPSNIEGRGEISIRELVKNCLRMRPDRIIVGEIRDGAALDMLQAMNTGHDGSITTVHANTPRDALSRIETMVLMAGVDLPVRAIRDQVAGAVDMVIQQTRLKDGSRRIVAISEVVGIESGVVTLQDIYTFDFAAGRDPSTGKFLGTLRPVGIRPKFTEELADLGVELPPALFADPIKIVPGM